MTNQRNKELIDEIVSYMSDFSEDVTETPEELIEAIESYGVPISETDNDQLMKNAIRHLRYIVNLWNTAGEPYILKDIGFTEAEIEKYYNHLYD